MGIPSYDLDESFWDRAANRYGAKASEIERDARLTQLVQQDAWIIEGVYYSWVEQSFNRAEVIGVLRPPVLLRDVRILKRFVQRKLGLVSTKRERLIDLYRLILWNHRYQAINLPSALESIKDYGSKSLLCSSADNFLSIFEADKSAD